MIRILTLPFLLVPLALAGCQESEVQDIEKPSGGKADEIERLCEALGEPTTCDPCDVANWYGDGVCDDFCAMPDTADCPAPVSTLASFLAAPDPVKSLYSVFQNSEYTYRFVATDLTQGTADAWTETRAAMIGDGHALHLAFLAYPGINNAQTTTIALQSTTSSTGACSPYYSSLDYLGTGSKLNIVHWQGAKATTVACTVGGSVAARWIDAAQDQIEFTFNVQFSDGTTWIDRKLTVDYN
jgi:hypothetical protein